MRHTQNNEDMANGTKASKASLLPALSITLNFLITFLVASATLCMIFGVNFMHRSEETRVFTSSNIFAFKYFTVDSNVLAGIAAVVYLCFEKCLVKRKITKIPRWLHLLRLASVTGVTLTMLITVFFLTPQFGEEWYVLFMDNNLFFHLIIPVLSIISFIFFEPVKPELRLKHSFFGVIPMVAYGVFYTANILLHLENGMPVKEYDWYDFLSGNLTNAFIAVPVMLALTWLISAALLKANTLSKGTRDSRLF